MSTCTVEAMVDGQDIKIIGWNKLNNFLKTEDTFLLCIYVTYVRYVQGKTARVSEKKS